MSLSHLNQANVLRATGWAHFCHLNGEHIWVGPKGEVLGQRDACAAVLATVRKPLSTPSLSRKTA